MRTIRSTGHFLNPMSTSIMLRHMHDEKPDLYKPRQPEANFDTVCVRPEIEQQLVPVVRYLLNPSRYDTLNIAPKGALLSGPPGTGKSALAEAIAGQAGVPFILISCASLMDKYVGETERKLRDAFKAAESQAPCVICFDEFDTLASERREGGHYRHDITNQLLTLLSEKRSGIVVIATTNSKKLDPAVIRAGRFDRTIHIGLPDVKEREKILAIHTRDKILANDVVLAELATMSTDFSGAQLATWVKEACLQSILCDLPQTSYEQFLDTYILAIEGTAPQYHQNPKIRHAIAVHEIGHALIAHELGITPVYVSITKNPVSYGRTKLPQNDFHFVDDLLDQICINLGGIAAEEIFGIQLVGSGSDIQNAVQLTETLIQNRFDKLDQRNMNSIQEILNEQKQRALNILNKNQDRLYQLVTCLHEHHFLSQRDFLVTLQGKDIRKKHEKEKNALQMPKQKSLVARQLPSTSVAERDNPDARSKNNPVSSLAIFSRPQKVSMKRLERALSIPSVAYALGLEIKHIRRIKCPLGILDIELDNKFKDNKILAHHIKIILNTLKKEDIHAEFQKDVNQDGINMITIHKNDLNKFIDYIDTFKPDDEAPGHGMPSK